MSSIRVGIVGSGFMGRTHAEALCKYVKGAQLVAVAGGSRAPQLAADYGIELVESVESLLTRDDIQAVVITTPQALHAQEAILAAKHAKHLLVEKPMASTIQECDAMIEACQTAGVNLMIGFQQRYRGANSIAKRLVQEGAIGNILMVEELQVNVGGLASVPPWQSLPENVGTFLGYGVHNLDRVRWLVGDEVEWVSGVTTAYVEKAPVEASSMVLLRFRNGTVATVWCTFECPRPGFPRSGFGTRIMGETGLLDVDAMGVTQLGNSEGWKVVYEQPKFDFRAEPLSPIRVEAYGRVNQEFIDSILERRSPAITGDDGRASVEIALAAYESSRSGKTVHLPLPRA